MADIISEAVTAISRINAGESLVHQHTIPQFLHDLNQFAQTSPEKAGELQDLTLQSLAGTYGYSGPRESEKPFIYQDGVAVIPVHGVLLNRFNSCWGFVTGYNFLRQQLNAVLDDLASEGGDVQLLAWDHNSPGGEAAGCFEVCREIMAARERVEMISVVDSVSASGGYALASASQRVVCIPSGRIGSIGVYRLHVDISKALEQAGIKYTIYQAGEHKTDLNPFEPPSKAAAADAQQSVEKTWQDFIDLVAEQRDMAEERVRDTQARVYRADEALDLGLIDAVNTPREAVSEFMAELANDEPPDEGDEEMALPKNESELQAQLAAARDEGKASVQVPDVAAATAAAVTADRERRQAIMALPEAEKRQKLAATLADGDYTVDQATALLKVAAEEAPVVVPPQQQQEQQQEQQQDQERSQFEQRMDQDGPTGVRAGGGGGGPAGENKELAAASSILADQAKFGGAQHRSFKAPGSEAAN